MADPFVAQLADLARTHRTANKWVLLPTHALGWTLGERLVHEGCDWVNLRFTTPFQLALEAAAPDLIAEGIHPCPENLGPSLVQSLLLDVHPLILQPGMAQALWATLWEALAGVSPGDYEQVYRKYLEDHRLADRAMLFQRPARTKVQADDFVLLYPYHVWHPLEQAFLDGLPGQRVRPHGTDLIPPRRLQNTRTAIPTQAKVEHHFFYAGRRDLEFQEILRRIDGPYDQVEIAAHREDIPLLHDLLVSARCPATFEEGLPIALSRPAQGLTGFLQWLEEGWTGFHIRELLMANLIKAPPNSWTAARLIKAAQIGWGRRDFDRKLTALADRSGADAAEWLRVQAGQARVLANWFRQVFELFPEGPLDLHRFLCGLQTVLDDHLDQEEHATRTLKRALDDLKLLPSFGWSLEQALRLIREQIRELRWNAGRPQAGHLHVTSFPSVGLSGRRCYLTGLEEGRWSLPPQDCILDDEARQRLHPHLALASDRHHENLFHIEERLATLTGNVIFSFSSQEHLPAWLYFQRARAKHPELDSLPKLLAWLGEPVQPWTQEESETRVGPTEKVYSLYPDLARGHKAELARASDELTAYDGAVPSAAGLWDPRTTGLPFSVSRLQGLASCPFQFFLAKGLGLYPAPLPLPDPDRWLDPAARGHILHEIYAAYSLALRQGEKPDIFSLLDVCLARELPPPSEIVERVERDTLRRDLEHFLMLEASRPDREQVGIEVAFGMGPEDEPLSRPEALLLDLGEGMTLPLNGRIDRIDRRPDGHSVVDYKTGKRLELAREGRYQRGRLLQHALYALAAEQLVGGPVTESGYYFTSASARVEWVPFAYPDKSHLRRVLELVLHPLQSGQFAHTHEQGKDCGFCDFKAACHAHRDEHGRRKMSAERRQLLEEP